MKQPLLFLALLAFFFSAMPTTNSFATTSDWTDGLSVDSLSAISNSPDMEKASIYDAFLSNESEEDCTTTFSLTPKHLTCGSLGFIDIYVSVGSPPFLVEWDNANNSIWNQAVTNSRTSVIPDLPAGTYTCKVTDKYNCVAMKQVILRNNGGGLSLDYTVTDAGCGGLGAIDIDVYNNSAPYWLTISGPVSGTATANSSTIHIPNLPAGNYEIMVEKNNCIETFWATVGSNGGGNLDFDLNVTAASCGGKGSAWVTVSGGTPTHTVHIWGDNGIDESYQVGSNSFELTDIPAGDYSIKIVDSKGCEKLKTFKISGGGSNMDFKLDITAASCGGKGSAWVTVSGGTPTHRVHIWGDNGIDESYQVGSNSFE